MTFWEKGRFDLIGPPIRALIVSHFVQLVKRIYAVRIGGTLKAWLEENGYNAPSYA